MPLRSRNPMAIPSGMLSPAGIAETFVNPDVQATTRPGGTLLSPSPGYDTVRRGKNRFQGKGFSGGFRQMEYAEEIGGTGAALAVTPGDGSTASLPESEWLPAENVPVIISDRQHNPGWARWLHDGLGTIPDMGDRKPDRPRSKFTWASLNPTRALRSEYQQSPELAIAMGAGLVYVVYLLAQEVERQVKSSRPSGLGSTAAEVPAAGARATGDVAGDAVDKIGEAADDAVNAIEKAGSDAVKAIENTADKVTGE